MTTLVAPPRAPRTHEVTPSSSNRRVAGRDARIRLWSKLALWASLLLVCYWWAAGGGIQQLATWTTGLLSAGRLTGLVAADLLLAQVLLMARIPFLESAFGQDRLAKIHRIVGFTSFNLMLAHVGLTTWAYAGGKLAAFLGTLWTLSWTYPGMLLAVAGTLCLVLVVVTSLRAARAKLRYESWHLLHLYAYLGVGLALPHQLWTGQAFTTSPFATAFWWTAWAATAVAVLTWRVGLPLARNLRHRLRVTSVVHEGDGVVSVFMTGAHLDRLPVTAGQFCNWRFLDREGWTRGNPYSLSAAPDGRSLRISVKALGDNSSRTQQVRPGTRVWFEGPYGRLTERPRTRRKLAFIGAGVGMAPLRALAEGLDYAPGDAALLNRFNDHALYAAELQVLAAERGLDVIWLPGHRRAPDSWLGPVRSSRPVDDLTALWSWVPDIADRDVYICGPEDWTEAVRRTVTDAGLPPEQLHLEHFRW